MTFCNGPTIHFFCYECARQYVQTEIGESRCRPKCIDTSDCSYEFTRSELQKFLDGKTFELLERMQQQDDIRLAGLENLAQCPFCDFQAEVAPVQEDREFRCQNPECGRISCRLCNLDTHIPLTCAENVKDNAINLRHAIEEAMTEAMIRTCK